jgi:hypothetical protein
LRGRRFSLGSHFCQTLHDSRAFAGFEGLEHVPCGGEPLFRHKSIDLLAPLAEPDLNHAAVLLYTPSFHQPLGHQFADGVGDAAERRPESGGKFAHGDRFLPAENRERAQFHGGTLRLREVLRAALRGKPLRDRVHLRDEFPRQFL